MKLLNLFLFVLSSCTYSDAKHNIAVGGKGAYKGRKFAVTWDNEKSFNDVAWVAMAAVPAVQAVKVAKSSDKLSAIEHTNSTKQVINASNNATAVELGAQKTGLDTVKATTIPH